MKNLFFSLLVVGVAVAGSAFTSKTVATNDFYTQKSATEYVLTTPSQYDGENCIGATEQACAFRQIVADPTMPTSLTPLEVANYKAAGTLVEVKDLLGNPIKGIYTQPE